MFSYKEYEKMICDLRMMSKYTLVDFDLFDSREERQLILIHDVDFDLNKAVEFSQFESSIGVTSTYFIQLSSEFYNCFSKEGRDCIKQISKVHNIGLHFNPFVYGSWNERLMKAVMETERTILSSFSNTTVQFMNYHLIGKVDPEERDLLRRIDKPEDVVHSPTSFGTYYSDSHGTWKYGYPAAYDYATENKIINTHPFWWGVEEKASLMNFAEVAKSKQDRIAKHVMENIIGC